MSDRLASNTGPLIALAKVDRLALLEALYPAVWVPPAVALELRAKSCAESARLEALLDSTLRIVEPPEVPPFDDLARELGLENSRRSDLPCTWVAHS